jgi:protein gp37
MRKLTMMPWTTHAWDPMTGCTPISEGCANCIAKSQCIKFPYGVWSRTEFEPTLHPLEFLRPLEEQESCSIFVVPQGDFFHEAFSFDVIHSLLDVMREAPWHFYYILTKRHERMYECLTRYKHWPLKNVNIGVSTENQKRLNERLPVLLKLPVHETAHRFISCEPILDQVVIGPRLRKLGAVICGMERGSNHDRPAKLEWIENLRTECQMLNIPLFHHGSGIIEYEQRPASDTVFQERQCLTRLVEYNYGRVPIIPQLKEILELEGITWRELGRRIGSEVECKIGNIRKGIIPPSAYRKVRTYIDNYYKGEKHAACG